MLNDKVPEHVTHQIASVAGIKYKKGTYLQCLFICYYKGNFIKPVESKNIVSCYIFPKKIQFFN
jgi:hypothetical protein